MASNVDQSDNKAWNSFSEETRQQLLHDDAEAWKAIVGILMMIVCFGVSLGGLAVFLISRSF
jgi:hypothetical protein